MNVVIVEPTATTAQNKLVSTSVTWDGESKYII